LKISNDDYLYIAYFFAHITTVDLKNVFMNTVFYTKNSILTQIHNALSDDTLADPLRFTV